MKSTKWLDELVGSICEACVNDIKGRMSGLSFRYAKPGANSWGSWLLQVAPSIIEIAGGREDGETVFDFVDVDLLALPKCLDEVETFIYDPDYGKEPHLTLVGKKGRRDVVVEIYFEPFGDDEPETICDVNSGSWRDKRLEQE